MEEKIEIWKRIESKKIADCRVFRVREDNCETEDGAKKGTFFVIESPDWVNIIALTKQTEVVLIEQFRHGLERTILEIPGGMVDEGEDVLLAAKRELLEETGYSSENWIYLGKSHPNPAIQNNALHHYLALDVEKTEGVSFDEHESVRTKIVNIKEIEDLIENEIITHSLVLATFQRFENYQKKGEIK